jgi:hypothetical protein
MERSQLRMVHPQSILLHPQWRMNRSQSDLLDSPWRMYRNHSEADRSASHFYGNYFNELTQVSTAAGVLSSKSKQ